MREHSYGSSILTIISAILLLGYLICFSSPREEKQITAEDVITEIALDDRDKLTEADKCTYVEDAYMIELGYDEVYDEPEYSMGGGILTIKKGGCYVLSGIAGQIIVNAGEENPVQLVLNNAAITSVDGPAIYAPSCSKLIITVNEGSVNTVSDSAVYKVYKGLAKGCIHSRNNITINGNGELYIQANKEAAIFSKDAVKIVSGKIGITSLGQGIYGEDKVVIYGGDVSISSTQEGIVSTRSNDPNKGYVRLKGGELEINCTDIAVRAVSEIEVTDCDVNIVSATEEFVVASDSVSEYEGDN